MSKERIEDLGRIRTLLEAMLEDEFWEIGYSGRIKDFWDRIPSEEEREEVIRKILGSRELLYESLCQILTIARGDEEI